MLNFMPKYFRSTQLCMAIKNFSVNLEDSDME